MGRLVMRPRKWGPDLLQTMKTGAFSKKLDNKTMIHPLIDKVFDIAVAAHEGQTRRDGVTAYIYHPMAVADRVEHLGYEYVCVAYLHDVLEDTKFTAHDMLAAGVEDKIVAAEIGRAHV